MCVCVCTHTHLYVFLCRWRCGYFHVLAIVNSAAMNIGMHISFELWFSAQDLDCWIHCCYCSVLVFKCFFSFCCTGASLPCRCSLLTVSRGYSPVAVHKVLIPVAAFVLEHTLYGWQASVVAEHRFNS